MKVAGIVIELPKTWQWANCSEVIDVRDGTHETPKYVSEGYPLVTSKNLKPDGIDFSTISYISEKDHLEISKRSRVDRNDILFAMIGTIGNPVLVDIDTEFSIKNVALFKFANSPIDPRYFRYLLKTRIIERQLDFEERGGTQKFVSLKVLRNMKIPYPPLEEQRRIAAILDKADGVRRKRQEAIRLTEELLKSTFLEMFGDPVTNPKGWEIAKLGDFGKILTGNTPPRSVSENYGDEIEWIKSDNITTPEHFLTEAEEKLSAKGKKIARTVPNGSVLVTCIAGSRSSIGRAALTDREVAFNQQINAVVPNSDVDPYFLYGQLFVAQHLVQAQSTDSMKGMVNKSKFSSIEFIKPPSQKQQKFGKWFLGFHRYYMNLISGEEQSENLFNSLLQRAFRGEL